MATRNEVTAKLRSYWQREVKFRRNQGPAGGGLGCFPKDTNALNQFMIKKNSDNLILNSTIEERNKMRIDNINII